jgi:hypothetical protein
MLERAWDRWRSAHGLAAEPLPPASSYVGYSIEEPWGRPRVVFGVDAGDAEKLAALLLECAGSSHVAGQAAPAGELLRAGLPQPGRAPQQALDKVRARIPVQGRTAELNGATEQRGEPASQQGGNGATEQRGESATEQRSEPATEQRGEPATEQRSEPATEQRSEPASQQGGDGASEQRGDGAREQRGEPASEQCGDGAREERIDEAGEQRGEPDQVTGPINGFDPVQADAHSEDQIRPAMPAGPDGLATPDDSVHVEQEPSAHAGSQHPGDSAVPRTRAGGDASDRRDAGRGVADTMAAELAGWAAGELPGQASARLAAWATVGGSTSRGGLDADLRTGGGAAEQVS